MGIEKKLGEKLKALREERGLSLREAGRRANVNYSYLGQIEKGQKSPSLNTYEQLCHFYGVELKDLLGKDMTPSQLTESDLEWVVFGKKMESRNLTQEELEKYIDIIRGLRGI